MLCVTPASERGLGLDGSIPGSCFRVLVNQSILSKRARPAVRHSKPCLIQSFRPMPNNPLFMKHTHTHTDKRRSTTCVTYTLANWQRGVCVGRWASLKSPVSIPLSVCWLLGEENLQKKPDRLPPPRKDALTPLRSGAHRARMGSASLYIWFPKARFPPAFW